MRILAPTGRILRQEHLFLSNVTKYINTNYSCLIKNIFNSSRSLVIMRIRWHYNELSANNSEMANLRSK